MLTIKDIKIARAGHSWSQDQLAKESGVSLRIISNIENKDHGPEKTKGGNIVKIAQALGIDDGTGKPLETLS